MDRREREGKRPSQEAWVYWPTRDRYYYKSFKFRFRWFRYNIFLNRICSGRDSIAISHRCEHIQYYFKAWGKSQTHKFYENLAWGSVSRWNLLSSTEPLHWLITSIYVVSFWKLLLSRASYKWVKQLMVTGGAQGPRI